MEHLNQFYVLVQEIPKLLLTSGKNLNESFKTHVCKFCGIFLVVEKCISQAYEFTGKLSFYSD